MSDDRIKRRLGGEKSQRSNNVDGFMKIGISNNERTLPVGEINHVLDISERFNEERQESPYYRIIGTIRPLMSNVLMNISGPDSWSSFDEITFRDQSFPRNNSSTEIEDLTYEESVNKYLKEIDGWFGYHDPLTFELGLCDFIDMEPKRRRFSFIKDRKNQNIKNWELTITYPSSSASTIITNGGLLIFDKQSVTVGQRSMTALAVPVYHNLTAGQTVRITGTNFDDDYVVQRIGLDNGDLKGYYFVIDVDPSTATIGTNSRIRRMVGTEPSVYYARIFNKVKTKVSSVIENDDYEVYPLSFSKNLYNDPIYQVVFNEDIDISDLTDNLGRPLSELYLTIIKTDGADVNGSFNGFTNISSGIEIPHTSNIQATNSQLFKIDIPDIRRIHNGGTSPTISHTPLENNITIALNGFYGDIVEYNRFKVKEWILADVHHRFNTTDRVGSGDVALGPRQEGYYYKAHHPIRIRNFSSYVEQGDQFTGGIPDYAEDLGDGRWLWRDLLDIGLNEGQEEAVDYPFLNGSHYIHQNYCITLKRQDPFGSFGLYYSAPINGDPSGDPMDDKYTTNQADDVC